MRKQSIMPVLYSVAILVFCVGCTTTPGAHDPLPSWNDGPAKRCILDFVLAATAKNSPEFVPGEQRIAVFDNDGTLWVEQPIYPQISFAIAQVMTTAPQHPEWQSEEPFKAVVTNDRDTIARFNIKDFEKIIAATHSNMTVEEFQNEVTGWLAAAEHPRFKRPHTELVYQPMLEVMRYLRAKGFKTYIVTGGGQDFVRSFADGIYGVPPEQVVGSVGKVRYDYGRDGRPVLVKLPEVILLDDKTGKPEGINMMIGRRPVAAFGNSNGDRQMLEYTQAGTGARLMMLVHHDDAEREYAYGAESKVGTFSDELMTEARQRNWGVISMKKDWKVLFPWQDGATPDGRANVDGQRSGARRGTPALAASG
ncbi:MAG TPA: HAD family hydrolase [Phycisphaerae bacterium]|nr:HAD family hydrolase [Phycisphaerae bacterium]